MWVTFSNGSTVRSSVPQGTVLGPVLFVAFNNDLPGALSSMCAMYADDTKVQSSVVKMEVSYRRILMH